MLSYSPAQFIEKMYTEALGRLPEPAGWASAEAWFQNNPANFSPAGLDAYAKIAYTSQEYKNLGYDNPATILTLYRGVLNREPDSGGFNSWLGNLNGGMSIATIIDSFTSSAEFRNLANSILSTTGNSGYGFGATPPINISNNTVHALTSPNYSFNP